MKRGARARRSKKGGGRKRGPGGARARARSRANGGRRGKTRRARRLGGRPRRPKPRRRSTRARTRRCRAPCGGDRGLAGRSAFDGRTSSALSLPHPLLSLLPRSIGRPPGVAKRRDWAVTGPPGDARAAVTARTRAPCAPWSMRASPCARLGGASGRRANALLLSLSPCPLQTWFKQSSPARRPGSFWPIEHAGWDVRVTLEA